MTEARYQAWTQMLTKAIAKAPKLESLPPTSEAFRENVLRANLQVFIWSKAHLPFLPQVDPVSHGWIMENGIYSPCHHPNTIELIPHCLKKVIRCQCSSEGACSSRRCGCVSAGLSCTEFCRCQEMCHNAYRERIDDEL